MDGSEEKDNIIKNFPNDGFYYPFIRILKKMRDKFDDDTYTLKGGFFDQSVMLIRRDESKRQINEILHLLQTWHNSVTENKL